MKIPGAVTRRYAGPAAGSTQRAYYSRRTRKSPHRPMTPRRGSRMLCAMKATSIPTKCHSCRARVEGAQHLPICDRCLDARLTQLEHSLGRPPRWTRARAFALGDVMRAAI
jgi:hypothetical protein